MARREADREDVMREALALRRRIALKVSGTEEPVVCGMRDNGHWSFYLDPDRVYQFDDELRLRRAYVAGFLYRTQGATLARMHRERSETETVLVRNDLNEVELSLFLKEMDVNLAGLRDQLQSGEARVIETIPPDANVRGELELTLAQLLAGPIELAPAIKTRR